MEEAARQQFEAENNITLLVNEQRDAIYGYDADVQKEINKTAPWKTHATYFKKVRISAVALLKMVTHARSGGSIEVMGIMQGKIHGNSFVIMDAYPLPVEGTETRVSAHQEAYEYMVQYMEAGKKAGRQENVVGWYHSHPGYGCWLSGIDVNTQLNQQTYMEPFVAVVIDPDRTISAGKVDIGAFRTYPEGQRAPETHDEEYQTIPLSKIEDFGAHSSQYYALEIEHFKSTLDSHLLDLLWNKYWVQTISQSPLFINRDYSSKQILDLSKKVKNAENQGAFRGTATAGGFTPGKSSVTGGEEKNTVMDKIVKDSNKIASEEITGLLSSVLKERIFGDIKVVENPPS